MPISHELLHLINEYQAGRALLSADFVRSLRALSGTSPQRANPAQVLYHKTDIPLFGVDVHGRSIVSLLSTDGLTLPPASFTTSPEIAKRHKLAKARENELTFGVIFSLPAERPRSVILDLHALYQSGEIHKALKESTESEFKNGILAVEGREHEIILDSLTMAANDVFAMRPPHQRIDVFDKALQELSAGTATYEKRSIDLYDKLSNAGLISESAAWLYGGKAKRVLQLVLAALQERGVGSGSLISPDMLTFDGDGEGDLDVISIPPY